MHRTDEQRKKNFPFSKTGKVKSRRGGSKAYCDSFELDRAVDSEGFLVVKPGWDYFWNRMHSEHWSGQKKGCEEYSIPKVKK
jgi:hypothetical protein